MSTDRTVGYKLVHTGSLVNFDIIDTKIDESSGGDEAIVRIELHLGEQEDEDNRTDDHEWGSFGFIFCLAALSFADARPRGVSGGEFVADDEFTVEDLLDHLRYERGELHFTPDYIRGRCMKTDITVRPDGTATLETRCRGEAATRWVAKLKGGEGAGGGRVTEFWFESDGVKLFACEDGAGRPIIMLHGGLADHRVSLRMLGSLASRFRIITPDLRASGKSRDPRPLSWDQLAHDVAALLDHLGLQRAVVGGVSSGTAVALRFALQCPHKVAGLVLVTPVYSGAERGLTAQQAATFKIMDDLGSRAVDEGVQVLRPLFASLPPEVREQALSMVEGFDAASVAATTHFLTSGAQPFVSASDLRQIDAPTLLVPGSDALHPAEVSGLYSTTIPDCFLLQPGTDLADAIGDFCEQTARW